MTDNEIIKALECCFKITFSCDDCPLKHLKYSECYELVIRSALDLINRQKAEIERLQSESIGKCELAISMRNDNNLESNCNYCIDKSKAEAVKEFAERLCDGRVSNDPVVIAVKVELKEMVGEG